MSEPVDVARIRKACDDALRTVQPGWIWYQVDALLARLAALEREKANVMALNDEWRRQIGVLEARLAEVEGALATERDERRQIMEMHAAMCEQAKIEASESRFRALVSRFEPLQAERDAAEATVAALTAALLEIRNWSGVSMHQIAVIDAALDVAQEG